MASLLLIVSLAGYTEGLPTVLRPSNDTKLEPSWVSDPEGRGTAGLMLSCVLTLGLCVWTAVHLNVEPDPSNMKILRRKVLWVLIGLFAPEIVLVSSYEQWQKARSLHKRVRDRGCDASVYSVNSEFKFTEMPGRALHRTTTYVSEKANRVQSLWERLRYSTIQDSEMQESKPKPRPKSKPEHPFSMTCSFFIVMGGTTIAGKTAVDDKTDREDTAVDDKTGWKDTAVDEKTDGETEVTLTPEGFEYLLDVDILPDDCLKTRTIQDKGKADFLAKFLVCIQAAWMILQCILRKLIGLPVTLLELNTLLHVVVALIMYYFWWEKPLNVAEPIRVAQDTELADILFALDMRRSQGIFVSMSEEEEGEEFNIQMLQKQHPTLYGAALWPTGHNPSEGYFPPEDSVLSESHVPGRVLGKPRADWEKKENRKWALWDLARAKRRVNDAEDIMETLLPGQMLPEALREPSDKDIEIVGEKAPNGQVKKSRPLITATERPVFLTKSEVQILFSAAKALSRPEYRSLKKDYYDDPKPVHSRFERDHPFQVPRMKNLHFDIDIVLSEIDNWEDPHIILSLLNIVYGAALASVWNSHFPTPLEKWMWRFSCLMLLLPTLVTTAKWITQMCGPKSNLFLYVNRALQVVMHPVIVAYFCARVFVVVESFISIRSLPVGSYETVQLSEYWPHF